MNRPHILPSHFSVILPCHNGAHTIGRTIESILKADPPPGEIIVVDDGSTDESLQIISQYDVQLVKNDLQQGPSVARNVGASKAKGNILCFIDADIEVPADLFANMAERFISDPACSAVNALVDPDSSHKGILTDLLNIRMNYGFAHLRKGVTTLCTCCVAIFRKDYERVGGFEKAADLAVNDEAIFGWRMGQLVMKVHIATDLLVKHNKLMGLNRWIDKLFNEGKQWIRLAAISKNEKGPKVKKALCLRRPVNVFLIASFLIALIGRMHWGFFAIWLLILLLNNADTMRFHYQIRGVKIIPCFLGFTFLEGTLHLAGIIFGIIELYSRRIKKWVDFNPLFQFQLPYYFLGLQRKHFGGGPIFWTFFVTTECNGRCPHCLVSGKPSATSSMLKPEEIERVTPTIPHFGNLLISGGEPFLREDLAEMIEPFYRHCKVGQITIPTNGSLPEKIAKNAQIIAQTCHKAKVNIRVSIDGPPKLHDRIRGISGGFELAIDTVRRLMKLSKRIPNLWVEITMTVSTLNEDAYDDLAEELVKRGIELVVFPTLCREPTRTPELWRVSASKYQRTFDSFQRRFAASIHPGRLPLFKRIMLTYAKLTKDRALRFSQEPDYKWNCSAGRLTMVLDQEGNVFPCETLWQPVGNIRDTAYNMRSILQDEPLKKFRKNVASQCRCAHQTNLTVDSSFSILSLLKLWSGSLFTKRQIKKENE